MAISFKCAGCGKQYSVGDSLGGKRAQCKECGAVMKIPALAAANEPDLRLDGDEPRRGGDETVAGSMVQGPLDTVTDRSVSGRSRSGRSMAGQGAAGQSRAGQSGAGRPAPEPQYVPPPVDDAPSELEALRHVGKSEEDAFEVHGGTAQTLREGRGPAQPNRSPPEVVSALLVALLIGALGYAAFTKIQAATKALPPAVAAEAGKPVAAVAVQGVIVFALVAAVAAPLVLAGWVGACKILNFRTPRGGFMRSFGLASIPATAFVLAYAVGQDASAAAVALATAGLGYLVLHFVHQQKPVLAGAAAALGTIGGAIGVAAAVMVADTVQQSMDKQYRANVAAATAKVRQREAIVEQNKKNTGPITPAANTAEADAVVKGLRDRVSELRAKANAPQQTREAVDAEATTVAAALDEAKRTYAARPEWDSMLADLQSTQSAIAQLPTTKTPADLNDAPPAGLEWGVRPGVREASAFAFNFTPPAGALIDLDAAMGSAGAPLTWSGPGSPVRIRLETVKASSDQQQRPWVAPAFVIAAAKDAPVSVALSGKPTVEFGTINGLPATKVSGVDGGDHRVVTVYTLHHGDTWLKATIGPAATGDGGLDAAEKAVRSLRVRSAGESAIDPLPAADLVARFGEDAASADTIAALLRGKAGAEEAVLKGIGFAPDDATLKKFGPLLAAAATGDKAARYLWKLADDDDAVAAACRESLKRVQPKTADDLAFALMDVKSSGRRRVTAGLETLESIDLDKARQPAVTRTLVGVFEQISGGSYGKLLEGVLGKWLDDDLGRRVQAVLDNISSGEAERRMAMRVLASTGKPKYVASICKWLVNDSSSVDTLVQMGPMVEGDVIKLINDPVNSNPKFRLAAVSVLSEVGTMRSVGPLQKITSVGDMDVRDAAKAAIVRIREREQSKPAQPH